MVLAQKEVIGLKIEKVLWNAQTNADMGVVCTKEQLDFWFAESRENRADVWQVSNERGAHLGTILTYVDEVNDGKKNLVIGPVCGKRGFMVACLPFLHDLADSVGADRACVSTGDDKVKGFIHRYGFEEFETTYYLDLEKWREKQAESCPDDIEPAPDVAAVAARLT